MSAPSPPPGWYQDPQAPPGQVRYWDGVQWTTHRAGTPSSAPTQIAADRRRGRMWLGWVVAGVVALAAANALSDDDNGEARDLPVPGASAPSQNDDAGVEGNGQSEAADPSSPPDPAESSQAALRTYRVRSVTDGDTLRLANGEAVRLVGMDAPEPGRCGSERATQLLIDLILGKRVTLPAPVDDRDVYGRLLRYVDVGKVDAGLRMIQAGLAVARYDSRDGYDPHSRERRYVRADRESKNVACASKPSPAPLAQGGSGGGCAGYSPCIPAYPPDLDCADVNGPIAVTGTDPHGLDADGDGVACES